MGHINGFHNVVVPARDLERGIATWTAMLGQPPAFQGPDFAYFTGQGVEIGLTAKPWVDYALVFWPVDDIEAAHRDLLATGATAMVEIADGSLVELGTGEVDQWRPDDRDRGRAGCAARRWFAPRTGRSARSEPWTAGLRVSR